jgi:hypothetical protein
MGYCGPIARLRACADCGFISRAQRCVTRNKALKRHLKKKGHREAR